MEAAKNWPFKYKIYMEGAHHTVFAMGHLVPSYATDVDILWIGYLRNPVTLKAVFWVVASCTANRPYDATTQKTAIYTHHCESLKSYNEEANYQIWSPRLL
jgi:hypothetical protein